MYVNCCWPVRLPVSVPLPVVMLVTYGLFVAGSVRGVITHVPWNFFCHLCEGMVNEPVATLRFF